MLAGYAVLLHRSVLGRAFYAIGFTAAGARYAGIPVQRRIGLLYLLSGCVASLAAIVYVAHLGQAKSDAGSGYELDAITAVVLGGTSVFGGRGTLGGTLLGLFSLSVLRNGLQLAALPSELTGVLTGTLLVATIAIDRVRARARSAVKVYSTGIDQAPADAGRPSTSSGSHPDPGWWKRDSDRGPGCRIAARGRGFRREKQSGCASCARAIVAGSLIVAGTNVWLVRSLQPAERPAGSAAPAPAPAPAARRPVIAVMPKAKGDPYFVSCRAGAEEAAQELGVELIWDGPTEPRRRQAERARRELDHEEGGRDRGGGREPRRHFERAAKGAGAGHSRRHVGRRRRTGRARVLRQPGDGGRDRDHADRRGGAAARRARESSRSSPGALSAANQNEWIAFIKKRLAEKYPDLKLATIRPSDDDRDKAFAETQTILRVFPAVRLVMAISAPAVPGSAEAVRQASRRDVNVIGLSLPNMNKPYVHDGWVQTVVLWNTRDLGYLTVLASSLLARNALPPGTTSFPAGRLGTIQIRGSEIVLGAPVMFTKANIDRFDF